jgi:hypothetical protein
MGQPFTRPAGGPSRSCPDALARIVHLPVLTRTATTQMSRHRYKRSTGQPTHRRSDVPVPSRTS